MAIAAGTRFNHYEILAPLGAGGMGEVYRARDTRLYRAVAIKVLPADFAKDADRLKRFEQEARATSALNHPNILTVYDIGKHEGAPFIVAELLDGEELRAQLPPGSKAGALPVRKALDYAQQVAAGLAAAHEKGIVHRDLKPENLFVTTDGRVKILDFGLAKLKPQKLAGGVDSEAATLKPLTNPGVILGTVGYMSPEQVRGQEADQRADIFSFGMILYEMLSGKRAFSGTSVADVMSAILKEEPPELSETNAKISPQLEKIVRRCLEKKPERRFQSASDLGFALEALTTTSGARLETVTAPALHAGNARLAWWAAALLLLTTLEALTWAYFTRQPTTNETRVLKFSINPPENASFDNFALSPDGKWLAFTAATSGKKQLWVRALEAVEAKLLAGTEGAASPFWSPESRFIGFFADGKLKKIEATGGSAQTLCNLCNAFSADWNRDGIILFARGGDLYQVAATGGEAKPAARRDRTREEQSFQAPSFLPDGRHFFYYIVASRKETSGIYLGSLDGQVKEGLLGDASHPRYVAAASGAEGGWLLFRREGTLLAQPFDARRLKLTGESFSVVERLGETSGGGYSKYAVSANGMLVYDSNTRQSRQLLWMDRNSGQARLLDNVTTTGTLWLAPDGKRFVTDRIDRQTNNTDLWLYDVTGANATRFTFDPAGDFYPLWSPDGSRIIWDSNRKGEFQLYQKAVNGVGQEEVFLGADKNRFRRPSDWSRDGRFFIYTENNPKTRQDIWVWPVADKQPPWPFAATEADEGAAKLSPDGRWLAYVSDETGRSEVYVQSFPERSGKRQVSTDGGSGVRWRQDGKEELFYHALDGKLMVVRVKSGAGFETDPPVALFEFRRGVTSGANLPSYDVTADGQRFLLNAMVETQTAAPLTVVVNWAAGAKK